MDRATNTEAEEANKVAQHTSQEQTVTDNVGDAAVGQKAEEPAVQVNGDQVIDEFCSNADYLENILSDENSVNYRFILKDTSDIEVFKNKVRQSFQSTAVEISNQHFEISGFEKVKDQVKFYMKIKDDKKAIEAILNLKTDNTLLMKIPKKKPNS